MAARPVCSCKPERGTSDAERIDPCLRWVDSKSESDGAVVTLINAVPVALGAQRSTLCWLHGTSVLKIDDFALDLRIFLGAVAFTNEGMQEHFMCLHS
jgi:hypothetical protein